MTTQKIQPMLTSYEVAERAHTKLGSEAQAGQIAQTVIEAHNEFVGTENYGGLPVIAGFVLDLIEIEAPTGQWESNNKQAIKKSVIDIIGSFLDENKVDFNGEVN